MTEGQEKLGKLREGMKERGIAACIIPSADPHLGENIPDHWKIISWLTGFTGSAATVVVTPSFAGLWTDSRYFIQAEEQLEGSGVGLVRPAGVQDGGYTEWLFYNLEPSCTLSVDGRLISISQLRKIEKLLEPKEILIDLESDLISDLWTGRPPMPRSAAFDHPVSFCGREREVKIAETRVFMRQMNVDYQLLTAPDDIMWLLNIRGSDLKYSPLITSFALVGEEQVLLFTEEDRIPLKLAREFDRLNIVLLPYDETEEILKGLVKGTTLLLDPATASSRVFRAVCEEARIVEEISIPARLKAIKNKAEIENLGRAMIKDGVALSRFYYWFYNSIGNIPVTEMSLADKLLEFRAAQKDFLGPSFQTIAAFNEHGALPHYSATERSDATISGEGILLIDSGGQYLDGTTDITRTIVAGNPTARQKRDFTLVLKGMISLAMAKFPVGTRGYQLDILARKYLWSEGLNYGHGTGHGVGFCLNVHEGPQSISPAASANSVIIEPGMLLSDEPALYREGEYGIRTENLILCYEDEETEHGRFLKFETMSLCFIDRMLIDRSMLVMAEIDWIDRYHMEVYDKLSPFLMPEEQEWLKDVTEPL